MLDALLVRTGGGATALARSWLTALDCNVTDHDWPPGAAPPAALSADIDLVVLDAPVDPARRAALDALRAGPGDRPPLYVADTLQATYAGRPGALRRDVTRSHHELGAEAERRALAAAGDGVVIADAVQLDHPVVYVNPGFERLTGYRADELLGRNCRVLQGPDTDPVPLAAIRAALRDGTEFRGILRNHRKDGTPFWNELALSPVHDDDGAIVQFVGVQVDVTARVEAQAELEHERDRARQAATVDERTGLLTRAALTERLETMVEHAAADGHSVGLLQIDLDRFRTVNDAVGHELADRLLCLAAARIADAARDGDPVGYFGEDQFVVVVDAGDADAVATALTTAEFVLAALQVPFLLDDIEVFVEASLGVSDLPGRASTSVDLLAQAERALYAVKDAGGGDVEVYAPDHVDDRGRLEILAGVREALADHQLVLHYQPIYALGSGAAVGVEALVRWQHPVRGLVPPGEFLPLVERTGLMARVGEWVIGEVCRQAAAWEREGLTPRLAYNVSPHELRTGRCVAALRAGVERHALDPARFTVEITESSAMEELPRVRPVLDELRRLGVRLAIDDFGSGYSSLSRLRELPVAMLKIDRTFLHGVPGDPQAWALMTAMLDMARALDLDVVAEGIEHAGHLALLREQGCAFGQGFHLARPMPAAELGALLGA